MNLLLREAARIATIRQALMICAAVIFGTSAAEAAVPTVLQQSASLAHPLIAAWSDFTSWVATEFRETPAIVLGVAFALLIPPMAVLGLLLRRVPKRRSYTIDDVPKSVPASAWRVQGILLSANNSGDRHIIGHGLVRIGREEDNDVQLTHRTVHRYHAIIERTPEAEFVIIDVSGGEGNGIKVDGERVGRARLRGGELIEIGQEQMRFQLAEL